MSDTAGAAAVWEAAFRGNKSSTSEGRRLLCEETRVTQLDCSCARARCRACQWPFYDELVCNAPVRVSMDSLYMQRPACDHCQKRSQLQDDCSLEHGCSLKASLQIAVH